jgi:peptidoglycan/xylan/chitin deacetylase (PgdA/CDA1 family)
MSAAKRLLMEPEPSPSHEPEPAIEPWTELTRQLRRRAHRSGVSPEDAEDRAQDALLRLVKERPRAGAPPLEVRAARALQLAEIDELRRRGRQKEIPPEVRVDLDAIDMEARLRLAELIAAVQEIAGPDAIKLLLEGQAGYTEAESNGRRRLGAAATGALRKRISRAAPEIAARIIHDLEGER